MTASTRHSYKMLNVGKGSRLLAFTNEYSRVAILLVGAIWSSLPDDLSVSKYQNYKSFGIETGLSARAFQCAANQAAGIVKACVEKQRRRLWVRENRNPTVKDVKFSKPSFTFIAPQLNANCVNVEVEESGYFAAFVKLSSLGGDFGKILVPIDKTSQFDKWQSAGGTISPAIKLFRDRLQITWTVEKIPKAQGTKIVGADQGYKTVLTLSDGQTTPECCPHGHSLESIIAKLSRKKKGSKAFRKAQAHRKNFTHWAIAQLNLSGFQEVRLEKVVNIRKGVRTSRTMSHWSNPEIRDALKRRCEMAEVPVVEQSCAYRSQRCSNCGLVRNTNRNKKKFLCGMCGFDCDADRNASLNHEADLPPIPFNFRGKKLNLGNGFLWNPTGIEILPGSEPIVPSCRNKEILL